LSSGDREYLHYLSSPISMPRVSQDHTSQKCADLRFLVTAQRFTVHTPPSSHLATASRQSEKQPAEPSPSTTPSQERSTSQSKPCKHSKAFLSKQRLLYSLSTTPPVFHTSQMSWIDISDGRRLRSAMGTRIRTSVIQ
jgi:hypothetical protein